MHDSTKVSVKKETIRYRIPITQHGEKEDEEHNEV